MSWKTSEGNRRNMSANSIRAMDDVLVPIDEAGMTSCFSLSRLEITVCYNEESLLLYRLASFYSYLCVLCVCSCMCECVCACACRGQRSMLGLFPTHTPCYFLKQGLSSNLELSD